MTLQAPNIAAQTVLPKSEVSIGLAIINLFSFLGASLFVTVAQTLLTNTLVKNLTSILPDLNPGTLADGGATTVRNMASSDQLPAVLKAYNNSMKNIWYLALGLACLVFVVSWGMEWKSVKQQKTADKEKGDKDNVNQEQNMAND